VKHAIPVSALKFDSTSSIEVLDEEILMIPEKEKDLEVPVTQTFETISIPIPESRSVPSSGNKIDQGPEWRKENQVQLEIRKLKHPKARRIKQLR